MTTEHKIYFSNANSMVELKDESVELVVTSPPYPMIGMWDDIFAEQDKSIAEALQDHDGDEAFELMNRQLDLVWDELYRVTKPGGLVCINIGDATRSINGDFKLYSNHSRILNYCTKIGFSNLPNILWRKQTNAPNKFMGSGMLPPGAYVTLEHEYILIFRKGGKRIFAAEESQRRQESAFFWEERNTWFSDLWELKGVKQKMFNDKARKRSGAFPLELAYRLVNMFSLKGDTVLDPFLGTGTTSLAAMASARNSIGYEIDPNLAETVNTSLDESLTDELNDITRKRLLDHQKFVQKRMAEKGEDAFKYINAPYNFPVLTKQERGIFFSYLKSIERQEPNLATAEYHPDPQLDVFSKESLFALS